MATRWFELIVAAVLAALGAIVVVDSLRIGVSWADDGPQAGYFPFRIGLVLIGASAWVALQQLRRWGAGEIFAERAQLRDVVAVAVPMAVFVALAVPLGLYIASVLLIGWFMVRHGRHPLALTAAVALGVPAFFYLVFERWFIVPLPKGPLALVGL